MGSDIEVIAAPCPTSHSADKPRKHFKPEIERTHFRDFPIAGRINNIETCIGEITGWRFGFLDEGDDSIFPVKLSNSARTGVRCSKQNHSQRVRMPSVERN